MELNSFHKIGLVIRDMRLKKGLSQEELSKMSGISVRTISRIESGLSGNLHTIKMIFNVLE
jgi:transcriptional regulator with XRE-family HTH domain